MVKKISAIILALVLCLSVMVVPVSALELGDADIAFELKWDKEYYKAGDTAYLSVYMDAADDLSLYTGSFLIGLNSSVFSQADNPVEDVRANSSVSDLFGSYWKDTSANLSWLATSVATKVTAACTAEENALYDHYLKFTAARNSSGSHENVANSYAGFGGDEFDPTEPIMTIALVVGNVADGTAVNAAIVSGGLTCSPVQTSWKYFTGTGANKTGTVAAGSFDVSQTIATATTGVEPCKEHTWNNGEQTTAPTCGEAGVKTLTCTVCGATDTEEIPATGNHTAGDPVDDVKTPASCNATGLKDVVVSCTDCGAEISRTEETIPATGEHNYANEVERVEPTCTVDGYYVMACGCGVRDAATPIPATGHDYDSVVTEPTCTEDGYTTYTCVNCQDTYKADEVESNGHSYDSVVTPPTCTEDGFTTYTCSVCGDTYTGDIVAAAGHSYDEVVTEPTCTEGGYTTYTCSACGDTYTDDETEAAGHNYEVTFVKSATCAGAGYTEYTCSACGDSYEEPIPSKNHKNEDGSSALVEIPAVEATCESTGYTAGEKCTICNTQTIVPALVPKAEHSWDEGVVTEPTYTAQGYTTFTCTVCGETKMDNYVPRLEANFTMSIREPSITKIRCKDTIVLHTVIEGGDADGLTVVWTADNENFVMTELEDGKLEITSAENGYTVFTATLIDADGNTVATDTVEMQSKADIWGKIGGFFRALFGSTLYYNY